MATRYSCEVCDKEFDLPNEATRCHVSHAVAANWELSDALAAGPSSSQRSLFSVFGSLQEIQEITSDKKSTHGGVRNLDLWDEGTTEKFLSIIKEKHKQLTSKHSGRMSVWREIHQTILPESLQLDLYFQMPDVTVKQLQDKWRNIKSSFYKYRQNTTTTGAGRLKKPANYELLCSFLADRPLAHPHTVTCGLTPDTPSAQPPKTVGAEATEVIQEESEEAFLPVDSPPTIPARRHEEPPTGYTRSAKRRRLRPPTLAQTMQSLHKEFLREQRDINHEYLGKLQEMIETQKIQNDNQNSFLQVFVQSQEQRNEILVQLLNRRIEAAKRQ